MNHFQAGEGASKNRRRGSLAVSLFVIFSAVLGGTVLASHAWHYNGHYSTGSGSKSWRAHSDADQNVDFLAARVKVTNTSGAYNGQVHGDQSGYCFNTNNCDNFFTGYVIHYYGHDHKIETWHCGREGSHHMKPAGEYEGGYDSWSWSPCLVQGAQYTGWQKNTYNE